MSGVETPMTVAELRSELKARGLPVYGTKQELTARLRSHSDPKNSDKPLPASPARRGRPPRSTSSDFSDIDAEAEAAPVRAPGTPTRTRRTVSENSDAPATPSRRSARLARSESSLSEPTTEAKPKKDDLKELRHKLREEREKITLFRQPITTVMLFSHFLLDKAVEFAQLVIHHKASFGAGSVALALAVVLYILEGPHQHFVQHTEDFVLMCGYWIGLGFLSSCGFGAGLHTFLLYLGPFIAKVTMAAGECGSLDFDTEGPESFVCRNSEMGPGVSIWDVIGKVRLAAFMWGVGTAIGELPPYLFARAASLSGHEEEVEGLEEIEELEALEEKMKAGKSEKPKDLFMLTKIWVHDLVQKAGFWGILLCASVPNPFFDLAGLTCGHFQIPFWTFFSATLIGKAIVKTHIQKVFVVVLFTREYFEKVLQGIETVAPMFRDDIEEFLHKSKHSYHHGATHSGEASIFKHLWELFIIGMVGFFIISTINAFAQAQKKKLQEKVLHKSS
eukprot:Colp12_sorted_trinity150504_noHs@20642